MVIIDMPMPNNCCNCPFAIADLINGIITLSCMTQTGRRMYAPGLISEKKRPEWCPLKEHEARILDWDELEDWGNAVWFEDKDEHECYIALIANVGTYDAKFTNVEPGNIHSLDFMRDFYMKEWRCWSARPTIKQRQAVKWE